MLGILPSTFISGAYTGFKSLHDQSILALLLFCFFFLFLLLVVVWREEYAECGLECRLFKSSSKVNKEKKKIQRAPS